MIVHVPVGETALIAGSLIAVRQLLLRTRAGGGDWKRWLTKWLRRGAIVALLVPVLGLLGDVGDATTQGAPAPFLWILVACAASMIVAGAALIIADAWLSRISLR